IHDLHVRSLSHFGSNSSWYLIIGFLLLTLIKSFGFLIVFFLELLILTYCVLCEILVHKLIVELVWVFLNKIIVRIITMRLNNVTSFRICSIGKARTFIRSVINTLSNVLLVINCSIF